MTLESTKKVNKIKMLTGTSIPLGALYTKKSSVIGEYTSLKEFADFCKKADLKIIQLLPVNDTGTQSSPYSGLSAFALHPIYADISAFEEFDSACKLDKGIKKDFDDFVKNFHYKPRYNYQEILNKKTQLLRAIYETTEIAKNAKPNSKLTNWIQENPWIIEYSVFKNLKWKNMQASWKTWSKQDQIPGQQEIQKRWNDKSLAKEHLFYAWLQWKLNRQFKESCDYVKSLGIILKGDMPILMNEDSCDAWANPQFFNHSLRAGSPVDGENPCGQNWGFPTYNWKNLKQEKYSWWKNRLISASQYYNAYRLDHILGFFRIWAIPQSDSTAILGHAEPYAGITRKELNAQGFSDDRIRWLSQPHVRTGDIDYFTWNQEKSHQILSLCCNQLGNEELWLFKSEIKGDKDIYSLDLHNFYEKEVADNIKQKLVEYWNNRTLIEVEKDVFVSVWTFDQSFAWSTLSEEEKEKLETLFVKKVEEQNLLWKNQATDILKNLTSCTQMQACGEDLGVGLECVPEVMEKENILGLNVVRWTRKWEEPNQPYIAFNDYRKLSVTTTSVHDSSTIRQWWQEDKSAAEIIDEEYCPDFTPEIAEKILSATASSASFWCIHPLQDFLYLDINYWLVDPKDERINVPGEVSDFNWTYRMPCLVEELSNNNKLIAKIKQIAKKHDGSEL